MRDRNNNVPDLRILLELSYANEDIGGAWVYIKRYLEALLQMIQDSDDFRVTLFIRANKESVGMVEDLLSDDFSSSNYSLNCTIDVFSTGQKINISLERLWQEHVVTPRYIKKWDINVVHWFGNHACFFGGSDPTVTHFISVHDLLPFEDTRMIRDNTVRDKVTQKLKRRFHKTLYKNDARRANRVFVPISDYTREQLHHHIGQGTTHDESIPVYTDVSESYRSGAIGEETDRTERAEFLRRHGLSSETSGEQFTPYFLYVAHFYPHKNHQLLINAYESYREEGGQRSLVLRGDAIVPQCRKMVEARIRQSTYREDIYMLPRLSADDMELLYACSAGQIFPSRHEGGGIPVMESLFYARPVACSRLPVFQEYYGEIPHYIESFKVKSVTQALWWLDKQWNLLNADEEKSARFSAQVAQVREQFSKNRMQQKLRKLYERWA